VTPIDPVLAAVPVRSAGTELHWQKGTARKPIIRNRTNGSYHQLSTGSALVWSLCDGQHSIATIAAHIAARGGPTDPGLIIVAASRLAESGLIEGLACAAVPEAQVKAVHGFGGLSRRILNWRITFRSVDPMLTWLYDHLGYLAFKRPIRALCAAIMASGFLVFVALMVFREQPFAAVPPQWLWFLPPVFLICTFLHEMGHAMATKYFGHEVIGAGFGWFWIGPYFFVDTSDMWTASRRQRILVSLAGAMPELLIAGLCSCAALVTPPAVASFALVIAAAQHVTILYNMSPLMEYDGYYALSDWLDRPNLRRQSLQRLFSALDRRPAAWSWFWQDKVAGYYSVGALAYLAFMITTDMWMNYKFFGDLFHNMSGYWPAILTWGATIGFAAILLLGVTSDVKRLIRSSPSPSERP
jgi:hypothetical protein